MPLTSSCEIDRSARGFIRLNTALLVAVLAAAVYFGWAYGGMLLVQYRLKQAATELANRRAGASSATNVNALVDSFLERVRLQTGLELTRSDVVISDADGTVWVEVNTALPLEFPWTEKVVWQPKTIEAESSLKGGY